MIMGATIRGVMHKQHGVANQDSWRIQRILDYQVAVVCDGVSLKSDRTFSNSELAAKFCARYSLQFLETYLAKQMHPDTLCGLLYECLYETNRALTRYLADMGIPFYDCQTTVLIFIYRKGSLYAALAGDGGMVVRLKDGQYGVIVTRVKTSPMVEPICDSQGWKVACIHDAANPVYGVIMATDGIFDRLALQEDGELVLDETLVNELFSVKYLPRGARAAGLRDILEGISSYDDKTAVVLIDGKYGKRQIS